MIVCNDKDSKTERVLRKAIAIVVVMAFILPFITPKVFAASGVTISGGDNVKGGETFTVAVTYGGGSVGRVSGQLTYDTDKLTYISGGSSSGNSGYIQLKKAGTGEAIVFNVKFQAVSEGSAELKVTTNEMYNLDEEYMDNPSATKAISIAGSADKEELITDTSSPDQPIDSTEAKGIDEKVKSGISTTMLLIVTSVIVAALAIIVSAILITKKKKTVQKRHYSKIGDTNRELDRNTDSEPNYQDIGTDDMSDRYRSDRVDGGIINEEVRYDENGNIARRSQLSKNKSNQKRNSKAKAAKKKYSKEETELWYDWSGWDDEDK